jgi:hypothetical protein
MVAIDTFHEAKTFSPKTATTIEETRDASSIEAAGTNELINCERIMFYGVSGH